MTSQNKKLNKSKLKVSKSNSFLNKEQFYMILGAFGYLLCLISDCILGKLPNGTINEELPSSYIQLNTIIEGVSTSRFALSGILGVISMSFMAIGMSGIASYMNKFVPLTAILIEIFGIAAAVIASGYHILFTNYLWFFIRMGRTEEGHIIVKDFMEAHQIILIINIICFSIMSLALFIPILLKKTALPRWASLFNITLLYFLFKFMGIFGAHSIGGILMCLSLSFLSSIYYQKKKNN